MNPVEYEIGDEVIAEPCEHCGADIEGWEYQGHEDLAISAIRITSVRTGGSMKLIPCGHYMSPVTLTVIKKGR